MKLYQLPEYPRRVYIDAEAKIVRSLSRAVIDKFEISPEGGDISHVIFKDSKVGHHYFPVGIVNIIIAIANSSNIEIKEVDLITKEYDEKAGGIIKDDMLNGITLRDYQMEGTHAGLYHKTGLLQIPTGGGKTEMMAAVTMYLLENTEGNILIGVPSTRLLTQTYDRLILRGISVDDISMLGGGNQHDASKRVLISTVQSAYNRVDKKNKVFMDWSKKVVGLLLDESHHASAKTWYTLADNILSEYTLGFSAEPFYGDPANVVRDLLLRGSVGSILYRIPLRVLIDRGFLSHPYVFAFRSTYNGNIQKVTNWHTVYKTGIVQNTNRNALICDVAHKLISMKKNPLVLVQQVQHGRELAKGISNYGHRIALLTGGQRVTVFQDGIVIEEYTDPEDRAKEDFMNGVIDGLIGTSVLDEGVDMPSISSVILAGGGKSKLKLVQRIGRGLRPKLGDNTTFIIDFQDGYNRIISNQFKQRKEQFDSMQFDTFFINDMSSFDYVIAKIRGQEN